MKYFFISLLFVLSLRIGAQTVITQKDFLPIAGKWTGTLTYLDYTSKDTVRIPANTLIELSGNNGYDQYLYYTAETDKNEKSTYMISPDGKMLNDMSLVEKSSAADGSLQLIFESNGIDGNDRRPARFRHIILLGEKNYSITKLVRFEGEEAYFQRHRYQFGR